MPTRFWFEKEVAVTPRGYAVPHGDPALRDPPIFHPVAVMDPDIDRPGTPYTSSDASDEESSSGSETGSYR